MSRALRALPDEALGRALAEAWPAAAWPATPDLVPDVIERLEASDRPVTGLGGLPMDPRRRRLLLIAAALVALAAVAAATKLVLDLGAISIGTIEGRPGAPPTASIPLGEPVTLEEAATVAGFDPLVPALLGPPDRVWVDAGPVSFEEDGSRVTMAWRPRPDLPAIPGTPWGAVLMQFEGTADVAFKFVYEDTGRIDEAFVDGREAYWTVGPHRLDLLTDEGVVSVRVRGRVLLWSEADLALRLESMLPKDRAVEVAESA